MAPVFLQISQPVLLRTLPDAVSFLFQLNGNISSKTQPCLQWSKYPHKSAIHCLPEDCTRILLQCKWAHCKSATNASILHKSPQIAARYSKEWAKIVGEEQLLCLRIISSVGCPDNSIPGVSPLSPNFLD